VSTVPTIAEVVLLPTLAVSLCITPPTDLTAVGAAVTSYTVTIDSDALDNPVTFAARPFTTFNGKHFVARLWNDDFSELRGEDFTVSAVANGSLGSSGASAVEEFELTPQTSHPATVRQRVFEILADAGLSFGGKTVRIQQNRFGKPEIYPNKGLVGEGVPFVECGLCWTESDNNVDNETAEMQHQMRLRVFTIGDAPDEAEAAITLAEKVRSKITALQLTHLGISDLGWNWQMDEPDNLQTEGKNLHVVAMQLTLPPASTARGSALF
jgi:hypothetical protein